MSVASHAVGFYPTISPLPESMSVSRLAGACINAGGIFSVPLSVACGSCRNRSCDRPLPTPRRLAVSQHPVLWSPDFPPARCHALSLTQDPEPAIVQPASTAIVGRDLVGFIGGPFSLPAGRALLHHKTASNLQNGLKPSARGSADRSCLSDQRSCK